MIYDRDFKGKAAIAAVQYEKQGEYWLKKFSGELQKTTFLYDFNIKSQPGQPGKHNITFPLRDPYVSKLIELSKGLDYRLYIILTAGLAALLYKYTGNKDIVIGSPIFKQDKEGNFINTMLPLRNPIDGGMTFKELLLDQVRPTIIEANEHQNYPIETLLFQLNMPVTREEFPLFDVVILLENIHEKKYIHSVHPNVIFSFLRINDAIEGKVEYNSALYRPDTINSVIHHFEHLLEQVLVNVNIFISEIDILGEEEKKQILYEFNRGNQQARYPHHKTLHQLFVEQVERTPDNTALVGQSPGRKVQYVEDRHTPYAMRHAITYRELNEKSNQLAWLLIEKGVKPDTIVGIMVERSVEMIVGILGILKAGGAYLPIDPDYPQERINYMLADSGAKVLLTSPGLQVKVKAEVAENFGQPQGLSSQFINIENIETDFSTLTSTSTCQVSSANLAYIVYTSGTTGRPKGILIRHRGFINLVFFHQGIFGENQQDRMSQTASPAFDAMALEVWPCLLSGAALYIVDNETRLHPGKVKEWLIKNKITITFQPTPIAEKLFEEEWPKKGVTLKTLMTGGDRLTRYPSSSAPFRVYNLYGPSEDTVLTTWAGVEPGPSFQPGHEKFPHIGKPIANHRVYIRGKNREIQPIGVPGELCIAGEGLAVGYLNQPELTNKKFLRGSRGQFFQKEPPGCRRQKIYLTGDLAKWQTDGNIEFLGRIDHQVKIRGFRIELGEIETCMLEHPGINEVVVLVREDKIGNKYLCAYFVPGKEVSIAEIRQYLSRNLPGYMIPAYFVLLERIPLNPNGKVDRHVLPLPDAADSGKTITPPQTLLQQKLVEIWADVLMMEKKIIGIDSDYFQLGGHSLNAMILISKIHKVLNVKIPLAELFRRTTIQGLAQWMKTAGETPYVPIPVMEKREYYEVSHSQKRIWVDSQVQAVSISYNMPMIQCLEGKLDIPTVEKTFKTLVQRHESLRTVFITIDGEPKQKILPIEHMGFKLKYLQLEEGPGKEEKAREYLENQSFKLFDLSAGPLFKVSLIRLDDEVHMFFFNMHHIISDFLSQNIFFKEIFTLYDAFDREEDNPLKPLPIQYKDYAVWHNNQIKGEQFHWHREYWLGQLGGDLPRLELPLDGERPAVRTYNGDVVHFTIEAILIKKLKTFSEHRNVTLFTTLFTILSLLFYYYNGQQDIVLGTVTAGREHASLEDQVGCYLNTLVLRTRFHPGSTFTAVLKEVKKMLDDAYRHQGYPFDLLVEDMGKHHGIARPPFFDVMVDMLNYHPYKPEVSAQDNRGNIKIRNSDLQETKAIFDLTIYLVEDKQIMHILFEYNTDLFERGTIEGMANRLRKLIGILMEKPGTIVSKLRLQQKYRPPSIKPISRRP